VTELPELEDCLFCPLSGVSAACLNSFDKLLLGDKLSACFLLFAILALSLPIAFHHAGCICSTFLTGAEGRDMKAMLQNKKESKQKHIHAAEQKRIQAKTYTYIYIICPYTIVIIKTNLLIQLV
jgi:hypothetical protein